MARGLPLTMGTIGLWTAVQAHPDLLIDRRSLARLTDDTTSAAGIADRLVELGRAAGPLTDDLTIAVPRHIDPAQSPGHHAHAASAA